MSGVRAAASGPMRVLRLQGAGSRGEEREKEEAPHRGVGERSRTRVSSTPEPIMAPKIPQEFQGGVLLTDELGISPFRVEYIIHTTKYTTAHRWGATRTTCTTRASPVRSRCRRARPCGSRPAAAAGPTPRRPSRRASPPRRPTPALQSSTCVESICALRLCIPLYADYTFGSWTHDSRHVSTHVCTQGLEVEGRASESTCDKEQRGLREHGQG